MTELFVNHPNKCLGFSLSVCVILSLVSFLLGYLKMNDLHERDYLVWDHDSTATVDLVNLANIWADEKEGIVNENQRIE